MKCPVCGNEPIQSETKYGLRNSCCGLWSWGKNEPLVDSRTHAARRAAHESFDQLWKSEKMTRTEAYRWLSGVLGLSKKLCHIKQFDIKTCLLVCELSKMMKG